MRMNLTENTLDGDQSDDSYTKAEMRKQKKKEKRRNGDTARHNSAEEITTHMKEYTDDLFFLNKLSPEKIAELTPAFKNEGRQFLKKNRFIDEAL